MPKPTLAERLEQPALRPPPRRDRPVRPGHGRPRLVGRGPAHRRGLRQAAAAQAPVHGDVPEAPAGVRRGEPACSSRSMARDGNMFTPEFFEALKNVTDEVFFLPGVDRGRVQSLFTPNVRYTEVVEDGIAAGNVIPDDFEPTPEGLEARAAQHPQGRHRRPAGGQRLLGRDRQRRADGVRPDDRAAARLHRRGQGDRDARAARSSTRTPCAVDVVVETRRWTSTSSASPR